MYRHIPKIAKANILIVDDNPKNLIAMKSILSNLSVRIFTATSGNEALKVVLRHDFSVIYLDVQMPGMGGYEVAKCLAKNSHTAKIPIVLVTAIYNDNSSIIKGYDAGAIDYLIKPIEPKVLLAKTRVFMRIFYQQKELSLMVNQLESLANNDTLTGLSNRNQFNIFFNKLLSTAKRYNRHFALLLLDLDNFKMINDTYGHNAGDILLKVVSKRLCHEIRDSDHIARLGGDEFAILLSEITNMTDASQIALNLIQTLSQPIQIHGNFINVTTSIGIATYPFAGNTTIDLFKAADITLYRAKNKGKNTCEYYTKALNVEHMKRAKLEQYLLKAIKNNEISLFYSYSNFK